MGSLKKYYFGKKKNSLVYYIDVSNPNCYNGDPLLLKDISGKGYLLNMINGPTFNNKGFLFDGINDYARTTGFQDIRMSKGLSIELYFEVPVLPTGYKELLCIQNGVTDNGFRLQSNGNNIQFSVGGVSDYNTGITHVVNSKRHVLVTIINNTLKIYLNGSLVNTLTIANQAPSVINNILFATNNNARYINFRLFQARIYTTELTSAQVLSCYSETVPKFI